MVDLEIPLGKRTASYRFFEMLPAILSYGAIVLLVVLSLVSPLLAAIYLMFVIITLIVKAVGIAYHTIGGRNRLEKAQTVNWKARLGDLEYPESSYDKMKDVKDKTFGAIAHKENLRLISADSRTFPRPTQLYNAVIGGGLQ